MADKKLDLDTLVAALDAERKEQRISWRQVAEAAGVSASTLTRMQQGKRPDVDTFAALVHWLGIPADQFLVPDADRKPSRPSSHASMLLRAKKELSPGAADALMELLRAADKLKAEVQAKKKRGDQE